MVQWWNVRGKWNPIHYDIHFSQSNHFVQINTRHRWDLSCDMFWQHIALSSDDSQPIRGQYWGVATNQRPRNVPVSVKCPLSHLTYLSTCHRVIITSSQSQSSIRISWPITGQHFPPCDECHVSVSFHKCMCLLKLACYCQYLWNGWTKGSLNNSIPLFSIILLFFLRPSEQEVNKLSENDEMGNQ